jgi:hypothetical protein
MASRLVCLILLGAGCTRSGAPGGIGGPGGAGGGGGEAVSSDAAADGARRADDAGSDGKPGPTGDGALDRGADDEAVAFCRTLAKARAERNAGCSGAPAALWLARPDFCASVEPGAFRIDATKAEACLRAVAAAPCRESRDIDSPLMREACREPFVGLRAPGGACGRHAFGLSECDPGSYCAYAAMGCGGTCVPRPKVGEPCNHGDCAPGLHCWGSRCRPGDTAGEGQTCAGEAGILPCASGFVCTQVSMWSHVCRRPGADGPCGPEGCAPGNVCIERMCRPEVRRAAGEPCSDAVQERCTDGLLCTAARCSPYPGLGEDCRPGSDQCREGYCSTVGRCTKNPGPGEACEVRSSSSHCVAGTYCRVAAGNVGTCVLAVEIGEVCDHPLDLAICGPHAACRGLFCERSPECW